MRFGSIAKLMNSFAFRQLFPFRREILSVFCVALVALFAGCVPSMKTGVSQAPPGYTPHKKDQNYVIQIGDVVQMDVFQEPAMTTRQRVQGDGSISIPLIGRIFVAGKSTETASAQIAKVLDAKQIINPQVTVTVLAYAPRRFVVMGQVTRAGAYVAPPEENVSLLEAIAMAGGPTIIGNMKKVIVSRKEGDEITRVKMNALSADAQFFLIKEGDVIYVTENIF